MSNPRFFFEPQDLDFHLRALALCDYQREVLGRQPRVGNASKSEGFKEQYFMWLLGEIINAAYLPFAGSLLKLNDDDGKYVWLAGQKLLNNYQTCLKYANLIFKNVSEDEDAIKTLNSLEVVTRKNFFISISHVAEGVLKSAPLRTKFISLQESFIQETDEVTDKTTLWTLIRDDKTGHAPWVIPKLWASDDADLVEHRLHILRLLKEALQRDLSEFENPARKSEFGTPEISPIRIAKLVRVLDDSARSSPQVSGSDPKEVFPAEVGTILSHLQKKLGIVNRRHFIAALKIELDFVELEQIEGSFFGSINS